MPFAWSKMILQTALSDLRNTFRRHKTNLAIGRVLHCL